MNRKLFLPFIPAAILFAGACTTGIAPQAAQPNLQQKQQQFQAKPLIYLYATGEGIVDKTKANEENAVREVEKILRTEPVFRNLAEIRFIHPFRLNGNKITGTDWLKLARNIQETLDKPEVSGIVVTHDSTTLEDTAYFLNLLIKSEKPIVLVRTISPVKTVTTESIMNFYNALAAAASPDSRDMGVLVSMNDALYAARDADKKHSSGTDLFRGGDFGPLGFIINGKPQYYHKTVRRHTAQTEFDLASIHELPPVQTVYLYSEDSPDQILDGIKKGVKGIVVDCSGEGILKPAIRNVLKEALRKGIVIVLSSRTGSATEIRDKEIRRNAVLDNSLSPQKAKILLMLALTQTGDFHRIQEYFNRY